MKNVLLMIVLGLFAVGYEEGWNVPMGPIGGTGCEDSCSEECIEREE
jgi:hypothetical protein